jgi:ribonuclease D
MPATSRWRERDPAAAARLAAARQVVNQLSEEHSVLAQNLLASDVLRRLCWAPPSPVDEQSVRARLVDLGARPWQIDLTAAPLGQALSSG